MNCRLSQMNHETLQRLVSRVIPYGKYKCRLIVDLPRQYLNWIARECFLPGEIGLLFALMLCKARGNLVCENNRARLLLYSALMFNMRNRTRAPSTPR
jgi:uncharacterized protein (DUF3820 family)